MGGDPICNVETILNLSPTLKRSIICLPLSVKDVNRDINRFFFQCPLFLVSLLGVSHRSSLRTEGKSIKIEYVAVCECE
jgi:hypothetical protein